MPPDEPFADLDPTTLAVRDLVAASQELTGRMAQVMQMNATDMSAIGMLTQFGPMGAAELARHLAITSASATVLVDRLEKSGHAVRVRDTVDRRRVTVTETPAARDAANAAWAPVVLAMDEVSTSLSASEREVVRRFLTEVTEVVGRAGRPDQGSPARG